MGVVRRMRTRIGLLAQPEAMRCLPSAPMGPNSVVCQESVSGSRGAPSDAAKNRCGKQAIP